MRIPSTVIYGQTTYKVTAVGDNAFYAKPIKSISIPASVEILGEQAFTYNDSLQSVRIEDGDTPLTLVDAWYSTFNCGGARYTVYVGRDLISMYRPDESPYPQATSITWGPKVTEIGSKDACCPYLRNAVISNSVKTIGHSAFLWAGNDSDSDAVEEAFYKLMFKKDRDAYEKAPETESDWFYALRWHARAELSHRRERDERHARYVEESAMALANVFACGHQGEEMDAEIRSRALVRALETLRKEQDISRRDLDIYTSIETGEVSGRELATRYNTTSDNVYVIKYRVGRLLRKYGPRCFEQALKKEGYISFTSAA